MRVASGRGRCGAARPGREFEGCHGGPGDGGEDVVSHVGVAARMRRLQQRHPVPAVPRRDRHSGFNSQWGETYVEVNERFAVVAAACAADNATVWVHDYRLQLVPSGLRRRRPGVRIGLATTSRAPDTKYLRSCRGDDNSSRGCSEPI
jgi:hypothetical protein